MQAVTVRACTFDEIASAPNFLDLCEEYARESAITELGAPTMNCDTYRAMEAAGILRAVLAEQDGQLVGFATLIVSELPHFSKRVASVESIFIAGAARNGGAWLTLRSAVERLATECGAVGILFSAPVNGRLDAILPRSGYRPTSRVYFRSLA
jgi:hypothetical protein